MTPPLLRVAHIDTERTWRGGEQQAQSLIQALIERNACGNYVVCKRKSAFSERIKDLHLPTLEIAPFGEWDFAAAHLINRFLKENQIDVIQAHTSHGLGLAIFSAMGTEIPVIATRRVDFHLRRNPFSRWKYKRASRIIAISNGVKRILMEDKIPEEKIVVIRDGIDFKRYEKIRPFRKREFGISESTAVIGQVAALVGHKDQATFIRAIALLKNDIPDLKAFIIGEGELRRSLERQIDTLGLRQTILLLGFKKDVLNYFSLFDVFCLSSKEEGLGTSILDAMALGVPVVATETGGIPEAVIDGVTGYLAKPRDPRSLAQTLLKAIRDHGKNQAILDQAKEKAREFDIAHTTSQTLALYEALKMKML